MRSRKLSLCIPLLVALLGAPALVHAQDAQALYEEGVAAYAQNQLDVACPKFKQSFEAGRQPAPLFMLAKCEEKQGRIASALEHFEEVLRLGGLEQQLQDQAALSVTSLGPRVPRVTLARGAAPENARAVLDGVAQPVGGRAILVDPGKHEMRVDAPGHEPKTVTFEIAEAQTRAIELEVGAKLPEPEKPGEPPPRPTPEPSDPGLFIGAGVAFGVGAAGFIVAGITGGVILDSCGGSLACESRTEDDPGDGLLAANYVGWAAGAAGAATGLVLVLVGVASEPASTEAAALRFVPGPGIAGLGVAADF